MRSSFAHKARLSIDCLEGRDVPAGPWLTESFDSTPLDSLPTGWTAWGTIAPTNPRVSNTRAVSGQGLAASGGSGQVGRAWANEQRPADVQVAASIFADTLVPAQIIARGRNLNSARPTYYAATVVRGVEIKLTRVVDGASTTIGSVRSRSYVSQVWLDVSLTTQGDRQQVRVRRRDTGQWLNTAGEWQTNATAALAGRDSAIASGGQVGLARPGGVAGVVSFDEFSVGPGDGDITPPLVQAIVNGTAGVIRLQSTVQEGGTIEHVEFCVDGDLAARKTNAPFVAEYETRDLANGQHKLVVKAWDAAGNVGEVAITFRVNNADGRTRPNVPRHYSHIRFAALAYTGNPMGPAEQKLLRESIDLVVPNDRYAERINSFAPNTPQFTYSNISNLYEGLLTDWLNFADRTGADREAAFYHVARPTAFAGDSQSSRPVNVFWNVSRGPANGSTGYRLYFGEAKNAAANDVQFGGTGEAVYVGYPERFREVYFDLGRTAGSNWNGIVEYATSVNSAGLPTGWKTLRTISDSLNGFRQSGYLTFDPPTDWASALVNGSTARLYYVRVRTTHGSVTEAPAASWIVGRDYVNARWGQSGTIPAFDSTADANRDGYLADAEYARRRDGFDARFAYESRLFYPNYGQMRFVTNPSGAGVSNWAADYHRRLLAARPLADGVFMDNSGGRAPTDGASTIESTDTYASDYGAVLGAVNRAISPKWVLANTSGGGSDADRVVRRVPGTVEEFALRPLAHTWAQFRDTATTVSRRLGLVGSNGYLVLDTLSTGGAPIDPRTRIAALAYYYLLADPNSTMLMTWGGEEPASAWSRHWFDAIKFNVGRPTAAWTEFTTGTDPANAALKYSVFGRTYEKALVLYKPLSYTAGKGPGGTGSNTATTHSLNGNYRVLAADGTLGPVVNRVTLRNGEGAILVKA